MIRYTARNGTTFQFDPAASLEAPTRWVHVIGTDDDETGEPVAVDLDDLREFLQHLDERLEMTEDVETDADCTAVGPD
jgi:hypothetical protein